MESAVVVKLMILVEVVGFMYYASRSRFSLQGYAAVNMILALSLSKKLVEFGGSATSVSCVWYTVVLASQIHIKLFYGRKAAVDAALMLVSTCSLFVALVVAAALIPNVAGNDTATKLLRGWVDAGQHTIPASFLGYAVAQTIVLSVIGIGRRMGVWAAVLAMATAQVADSLIYFPAAFRSLDPVALADFTLSGIKLQMYASLFMVGVAMVDWRKVFYKTHQRAAYATLTARH